MALSLVGGLLGVAVAGYDRKHGVLATVEGMKPLQYAALPGCGSKVPQFGATSPYRKLPGSATRGYECRRPDLGMTTWGNVVFSSRSVAAFVDGLGTVGIAVGLSVAVGLVAGA